MAKITTDDDKVTVTVPSPDGDIAYEVWAPTPEQLLVFSSDMQDTATVPTAVMQMLADVFEDDDLQEIRTRLRARRSDPARLQLEDLMRIIEQLMEASTDFPTGPSSDSPAPPSSTGRRSTGRVHSPASTRVLSAAAGS